MGINISQEERNYSDQIYQLRQNGQMQKAIVLCLEAIGKFNRSNFFNKICGDMYYELGLYSDAINMYMEFLEKIKETPVYFLTLQILL